jgi:hypothetical protein
MSRAGVSTAVQAGEVLKARAEATVLELVDGQTERAGERRTSVQYRDHRGT